MAQRPIQGEKYMQDTIARAIALHRDAFAVEAYRQARVHDDFIATTKFTQTKEIAQRMVDTLEELRKQVTTDAPAGDVAAWTRGGTTDRVILAFGVANKVLAVAERQRLRASLLK